MSREDIFQAARVTAELGLLTMCHFLLNLPGETESEIQEARDTLDKILEIHHPKGNLGAVIFNHIRLYPGAPLNQENHSKRRIGSANRPALPCLLQSGKIQSCSS